MVSYAAKNNVSITVSSLDFLNLIFRRKFAPKLKIHLKIETGLNRQGINLSQIGQAIKLLEKNSSLILEGVYTHFANAKNPNRLAKTKRQIKLFTAAINQLNTKGFNFIAHASATSSSLIYPQAHFGMVRIGIGLYGLWPSEKVKQSFSRFVRLKPALSWRTIISEIKKVKKGQFVGYEHTGKLSRDSQVAICPVGYWHGYPRSLSGKGYFLVNGQKANILGVVSMDMVAIDVTEIKKVKFNQTVTIIGKDKSNQITVDELAKISDTTNYQLITGLNPLIKRFYL